MSILESNLESRLNITGCFIMPLFSLSSPLYPNLFLKDARFLFVLLQTRAPLNDPGVQDQAAAAAASQQMSTRARFIRKQHLETRELLSV